MFAFNANLLYMHKKPLSYSILCLECSVNAVCLFHFISSLPLALQARSTAMAAWKASTATVTTASASTDMALRANMESATKHKEIIPRWPTNTTERGNFKCTLH